MPEGGQLSVNDRVLLHLSRFANDLEPDEYPPETTQLGIAAAIGISRTHVPRAVKGLLKEGLVSEITARVKGHDRRMKVYVATREGMRKADDLLRAIRHTTFQVVREGRSVPMTGSELEEMVGRKRALTAISQMKDGVVSIDETRRPPIKDLSDAPSAREFYGRDEELDMMEEFMGSEAKVLVILASRGYGASTLARKFADEQEEADVLWISIGHDTTAADIESRLVSYGKKLGADVRSVADVLRLKNLLIVFDGYFSPREELVEFFSKLVDMPGDAKMVVTAREDTPAYDRFYQKGHVDSKVVAELRLKGLDEQSAAKLLGNDRIDKDAFRRIMQMTRGQPMALRMLRDRDYAGLKGSTLLTAEEVRYLMFLRDKSA
ncbi:MAG: hypothetical protein QXU73_04270 [Thermoplasmata archaeon]